LPIINPSEGVESMGIGGSLSVTDLELLLAELGVTADRTSVALALRAHPVEGVVRPEGHGHAWKIPRDRLVDVVAAVLLRRARRSPDRWRLNDATLRLDAAELLLDHHDHALLVPAALRRRVERRAREQQERRERQELEEQERLAAERRAREEAARRAHEREREQDEAFWAERERRDHEWHLNHAYTICRHCAYVDHGSPKDAGWPERPENKCLREDFPHRRPDWWLPPPGLLEAATAYVPTPNGCATGPEPDWSTWVPRYVPGRPWPWRRKD
jgi:hypothetical protein